MRLLFPGAIWREKTVDKRVFLTFDDGPVPGITPWVIEQLKKTEAKATFFCIGDNVRKYPGVFDNLKKEGFGIGCHGFSHKPGHKAGFKAYLKDIDKGLEYCGPVQWFRPPHGIIFPWWIPAIRKKGLNVVLWDVLSCDYDRSLLPQEVTANVLRNIRPGSIIVFHDSLKAWPNLKVALPEVLKWIKLHGYTTGFLTSINQNKRIL
jgi:peptidoglycan/xylan/chitin deacetylase (PgdA/CDA1 family)